MKRALLSFITLFLLTVAAPVSAQLDLNWVYNIKAEKHSHLLDFFASDDNFYLAYSSKGEIDDSQIHNIAPNGSSQGSLIKMDSKGEVYWQNTVVANKARMTNIAKANDGSIIAIGTLEGDATFESNNGERVVQSTGSCSIFIARYNADGELIDVNTIEQTQGRRNMYPTALAMNSLGELYVGLHFYSALKSQGQAIEKSEENKEYSAVMKFSKSGQFMETVKQWDLIETWAHVDVDIDSEDNVIISGFRRGKVHLSEEVTIACSEGNIYDENTSFSFIAKYNSNNQLQWHQKIGGRNNQLISDLVISRKNEIYLCGAFTFECIFSNTDPLLNTDYSRRFESSMFYAKLGAEGELIFVKYYRSRGGNSCNSGSLCIDDKDRVHLTGSYNGNVNFNSSAQVSIGEILENNPRPRNNWRINTRGNSAWFHSVWKENSIVYFQNLYDLNGYPDTYLVRKILAHGNTLLLGGIYHIGKPTILALPNNIELQASDDAGMNSLFVSATIPDHYLNEESQHEENDSSYDSRYYGADLDEDEELEKPEIEDPIGRFEPVDELVYEPLDSLVSVNVYPNPARDYINIDLNDFSAWVDLMLVTETGAIVYSQSVTQVSGSETLQLNLSSFSSGTYYLIVTSAGFRQSYPVVKVR